MYSIHNDSVMAVFYSLSSCLWICDVMKSFKSLHGDCLIRWKNIPQRKSSLHIWNKNRKKHNFNLTSSFHHHRGYFYRMMEMHTIIWPSCSWLVFFWRFFNANAISQTIMWMTSGGLQPYGTSTFFVLVSKPLCCVFLRNISMAPISIMYLRI